jgi:hypothetical protein
MSIRPISDNYRKDYQDFSGGLNTHNSPLVIPAKQFAQLDNFLINDKELLEKAPGYVNSNQPFPVDVDSFIRMLVTYRRGSSVEKLIAAALDEGNTNATYKVDLKESSGDGNWSYIGYTTGKAQFTNGDATVVGSSGTLWLANLKAGDKIQPTSGTWYEVLSVTSDTQLELTTNFAEATTLAVDYKARPVLHKLAIPRASTFNNKLIVVDGHLRPISYDNSTTAVLSNAPTTAKLVEIHKNRVFFADDDNIYWSLVNDETQYDPTSFEPIYPYSGGTICSIKSFADSLIVFKDNGRIFQVVGSFDQSAEGSPAFIRSVDTPENLGVISGYTPVVHNDNKLYFLCQSGIYSIDQSMQIKRESLDISPEIRNLVLKSSITGTNSFLYDTKTQWDTGTHSGTRATSTGEVVTYGDLDSVQEAQVSYSNATAIGSDNKVYTAYVTSNLRYLKVKIWNTDGTTSTETVADSNNLAEGVSGTPSNFLGCRLAVSSSNKVGVLFTRSTSSSGYVFETFFAERVTGVWTIVKVETTGVQYLPQAVVYNGSEDPRVTTVGSTYTGRFSKRLAGVWSSSSLPTPDGITLACEGLLVTGTNNLSVMTRNTLNFFHYITTDDGGSWTLDETITVPAGEVTSRTLIAKDNVNDIKCVYMTLTNATSLPARIVHRNLTRNVSTTISTSTTDRLGGYTYANYGDVFFVIRGTTGVDNASEYFVFDDAVTQGTSATFLNGNATVTGVGTNFTTWLSVGDRIKLLTDDETKYGTIQSIESDLSLTLTSTYTGSSSTGAYVAVKRRTILGSDVSAANVTAENPSTAVQLPMVVSNGNVLASLVREGSNGIRMRRMCFRPSWTSPEMHDTTLSEWGIYYANSVSTPNASIVYQNALDTATMANPVYAAFTPPAQVSTNTSKNYLRTKLTFVVSGFTSCSIGSIDINYVGSGVDAKLPSAICFDNELFFAVTTSGESANNKTILYDHANAWSMQYYPVTFMTRFKEDLYGGSSTSGEVFLLKSGFSYDGAAYDAIAVLKEDMLGSLELEKDIYKIYVLFETQSTGSFDLSYRLDNFKNGGNASWTSTTINQTSNGFAEVLVGQKARSIQLKISNSNNNEESRIIGLIILYGYLNLR